MIATGNPIAIPGIAPVAQAANANRGGAAENSLFDNSSSGPQVIDVGIIDRDLDDTDQAKGEPDVTVNGKILRMAQVVDGNWYGYFADKTQASIADFTALGDGATFGENAAPGAPIGQGLDFGEFCTAATAGTIILDSATGFTDTVGVALPANLFGGANGTATGAGVIGGTCLQDAVAPQTSTFITNSTNNVVREAKDLNIALVVNAVQKTGQLSIVQTSTTGIWPFIQLYSLNPTGNVIVQYNKGGGVQSTTLTFDTVDNFASASLDKSIYTRDSQVHITVTDLWLNIDPTDEDSWTFGTNATAQGTVAGSTKFPV
jgi:hypothetical protein